MGIVRLRIPGDEDWTAILAQADAALPWDAAGNREWLENRKQFSGRRRHYVAEESSSGNIIGYGAIEEGPDPGSFRVFVVMDRANLATETGALIYERLSADLRTLDATGIWAREYAEDTDVLAFFIARGFVQRDRFTLPGLREMVVLVKRLA